MNKTHPINGIKQKGNLKMPSEEFLIKEKHSDQISEWNKTIYQDFKNNLQELINLKPKDIVSSFINKFHS
nr:hypothetical protein [uncultured Chryseobacterium sp.]